MKEKNAPKVDELTFHYVKKEYATNSIQNGLKKGILTAEDADLIQEFVTEMRSQNDIGVKRANKIVFTLVNWRRFIGPYTSNTLGQIYEGIDALKSGNSQRNERFTQNTIRDYILFLKRFYAWLIENEHSDIKPWKIEKIRAPAVRPKQIKPEDILTKEEIRALINACKSSRDRALVAVLYESGCRIGELGHLTWKRLQFHEHGVALTVKDTKCEKERFIPLFMAPPYLAAWRNDYPFAPEGDALVFITNRNNPVNYSAITRILSNLMARAGISKHVTPHLFRHTRVTHLINEGMAESTIKLMIWNNITTDMFRTYAHVSNRDIEKEVMRHYGIAYKEDESPEELQPKICSKCYNINTLNALFCSKCNIPLSEEVSLTLREMEEEIRADPMYQQCLAQMGMAAA